jgi:hypothetical protein
MRIELHTDDAYVFQIDSWDLDLIGQWFAEHAKILMSANARMGDCRMRIWPSTYDESKLIPEYHREVHLTQDDLLDFAGHILAVSQKIAERDVAERDA